MLTIDIGNSRIKWARFQGGEIVSHRVQEYSADSFEAALNRLESASENDLSGHWKGKDLKMRVLRKRGCSREA